MKSIGSTLLASAAAIALISGPAYAQDEDDQNEDEIIVTATKR